MNWEEREGRKQMVTGDGEKYPYYTKRRKGKREGIGILPCTTSILEYVIGWYCSVVGLLPQKT